MKKLFIIDGYNVIHKNAALSAKLKESLESARRGLALFLSQWKRSRPNAEIRIVFDGADMESNELPGARMCGIEYVFTRKGESADDRIISIIRNSENPGSATVISADNKIRRNCRAHGANVEYPAFLEKEKKKHAGTVKAEDKASDKNRSIGVTYYYEEYLRKKGIIKD